jgi:predicted MPP superfamily phosphohydrolase
MMRSSVDSEQAWIQGLITDLANVQIEGRDEAKFRAVFISDIHLGTMGCQAVPLLEFLKVHTSDYLYLVGDIIDGCKFGVNGTGRKHTMTWFKSY